MKYLFLILPALAACVNESNVDSGAGSSASASFAGGAPYVCDTGSALRVQQRGGSIGIALDDGRTLDLPRISGGSGTRYGADGWVWFTNGSDAILTEQGGQANCRPSTQAEFQAAFEKRQPLIGNEPVGGFRPAGQNR